MSKYFLIFFLNLLIPLTGIKPANAAATSTPPQTAAEVYEQCENNAISSESVGIAATQAYAASIIACLQEEINQRLISLRGTQDGEKIAHQIDELQRPIIKFYGMFTESNRYYDYGGNLALSANIVGLNQFIKALLYRLSDTPADYNDQYQKYVDENSNLIVQCRTQSDVLPQQCLIRHIQEEIKKGFKDKDIDNGLQQFTLIYESDKNIYNNIYPDNPKKAAAAVTEDLEYILRRLLFLNLTREGY